MALRSGESLAADLIVLAVPFDKVLPLGSRAAAQEIPALDRSGFPACLADRGSASVVRQAGVPFRPRRDSGATDPVGVQPHGDPGARRAGFQISVLTLRQLSAVRLPAMKASICNWSSARRTTCWRSTRSRFAMRFCAELAEIWPAVKNGQSAEIVGRRRTRGDLLRETRCRCPSPVSTNSRRRAVSRRGLDRYGLARHDGRGGSKRVSGGPGNSEGTRSADSADPAGTQARLAGAAVVWPD